MGDVSHIPEDTWTHLLSAPRSVVVLDCLRPEFYVSHFGLGEAVEAARRLKPTRTYLTGLGHEITFDEYTRVGRILEGATEEREGDLTVGEQECLSMVKDGEGLWLRPAHDGLRVWISNDGEVRDETHDV